MIYGLVIHNDNKQTIKLIYQFSCKIYKNSYNLVFFHFDQMKKLIINEKNLPKLNKPADIGMKFRIKNPSYAMSGKKEKQLPLQIEIAEIIQHMQACVFKNQPLSQQNIKRAINILKSYKDSQNNSDVLLTQSLKFSKVRLKFSEQDKQNNFKKIGLSSEREDSLKQKSGHYSQMRKITLPYKRSTQKSQNKQPDSPIISWQRKQSDYYIQKIQKYTNTEQNQIQNPAQILSIKGEDFQQKEREIQELNQRIAQLTSNIESLLKKQSLKCQEMEKIQVQNARLLQKTSQLQIKIHQLSNKNEIVIQKITTSQQETRYKLQKELNTQEELKLQSNNLKSENEVLLQRLKQRESELIAAWEMWQKKQYTQS